MGNYHIKGQRASSFGIERQKGEEGARKCKRIKNKAAEQKNKTRGTQRARSERGHQEGPQAACGSATARR